jgi:hypothetical protein
MALSKNRTSARSTITGRVGLERLVELVDEARRRRTVLVPLEHQNPDGAFLRALDCAWLRRRMPPTTAQERTNRWQLSGK